MRGRGGARALAIAGANLRRTFRDRTALFFILVLPVVIIIVIGSTFGAGDEAFDVGLVNADGATPMARELVAQLERSPALEMHRHDDRDRLLRAVRRDEVLVGVVVPAGYDGGLRRGGRVAVELLADPTSDAAVEVRSVVGAAVARQGAAVAAARFGATETGEGFDAALADARALQRSAATVGVEVRTLGGQVDRSTSRFAYTAPSNLVLFVFVNSMAAAGALVETRRLGVSRRMLATPASARTILAGEALGRFALALVQAVLILLVGALVFGVDWGDPPGAGALVLVFALVATGAAMLVGTLARTADQAGSVGAPLGIALGMLGGCMWPLEIVGDVMRQVGHVVPHAWAMDAWSALIFDGEALAGITTDLAVLAGWAAVLLVVATVRLRRVLVRP